MAKAQGIHAIGRRKTSVARVYLREGDGKFIINKQPANEYFGRETLRMVINQPLALLDKIGKVDVIVNVNGGGPSGQAGAVRHGLARALNVEDRDANRASLKKAGYLSRDARAVERKKYGRHKARKRPQFSKR
ncbi:MAG: 30S ribosomal protein S9 [Bdellovibrionales bacterium]|nr:30S ribosomal protein S9 [Bdellovibrionales bacterium]